MIKKQDKKATGNFLDYVPVQSIEWRTEPDGSVCLVKERSKNKWIKKLIALFNRDQYFYLHLDDLGGAAWRAVDNKRTIGDICALMQDTFGDELVQAEQRVSHFMAMLKRNGFIDLTAPPVQGK